jgi:LCP family protein required for cell wall assembly
VARHTRPQRGRHATPSGQGFGYLVGWTLAGTVLPGVGLVAAGRRTAGWLLMALSVGAGLGVLFFVVARGGVQAAALSMRNLALDPARLTQLAIVAAVGGVAWSLVVLISHLALRKHTTPTRGQNILGVVLTTALVLGIALPAAEASNLAMIQKDLLTSVFSDTSGKPNDAAPSVQKKDPWASVPRVNVLLMGSDAGKGRRGLRPDTMILASVNTKTGDTVMFSLPRNLQRAPFPEGSEGAKAWPYGFGPVGSSGTAACGANGELCWLNAVWRTAEESAASYFPGDKDPGLTATEQAIEGVLGLKVDYFIMLNLKGFEEFIDAIHGVRIDVKERLPMGGNSEDKVARFGYIEPGENQKMNGFRALWFARSRWSTDDYDRMRRQRCVIAAVAEQADPLTVVKNFNGIAKALKHNLQTDIPVHELTAWGDLAMRVKDGKVRSLPFTRDVIRSEDPDWEEIRTLVRKSLKPPKTKSATSTVSPGTDTDPGTDGDTGSGTTTKTKTSSKSGDKPVDPTKAQDVGEVC